MIALFAALALATPQPVAARLAPLEPLPAACQSGLTKAGGPSSAHFSRLADLPDAKQEIAVAREIGGCPAPIVVRDAVTAGR